jgi:hypothetical protein
MLDMNESYHAGGFALDPAEPMHMREQLLIRMDNTGFGKLGSSDD